MDTFLFDVFSSLTGGLIIDLKTVMLALFGIVMMIVGYHKIISVLGIQGFNKCHNGDALGEWKEASEQDGFEGDYASLMYKKRLNARVNHDIKHGKGC